MDMGWKNLPGNRPRKQHLGTADRNSAKKPAAGSNTKKQHPKVAPRSSAKKQGAGNGNRTYLKRVQYLQTPNNQLLKKIQLAFDQVIIPLKSEFNFDKLLIVNDLTKCNSLQTSFSGDQGNNIFAEGMRERMDWWDWWANRILPAYFTPHSQPSSFGMINNQRFTKAQASFGYLRKYPSADVVFINYLLSMFYKSNGWLWGRKRKIPTGIIC